jgi:hypothetical protein
LSVWDHCACILFIWKFLALSSDLRPVNTSARRFALGNDIFDLFHEQAMMSIQTGKHQEMYNTNMSVSTAKDIFAKIWDKPVCDLFVESDMPGFSGVCTVQESSGSCSWCSGKSARPGIVDEQIVAQTAQWFSGLMQVIASTPFSYLELIANTRMEIFFYSFLICSQTL